MAALSSKKECRSGMLWTLPLRQGLSITTSRKQSRWNHQLLLLLPLRCSPWGSLIQTLTSSLVWDHATRSRSGTARHASRTALTAAGGAESHTTRSPSLSSSSFSASASLPRSMPPLPPVRGPEAAAPCFLRPVLALPLLPVPLGSACLAAVWASACLGCFLCMALGEALGPGASACAAGLMSCAPRVAPGWLTAAAAGANPVLRCPSSSAFSRSRNCRGRTRDQGWPRGTCACRQARQCVHRT